MSLSFLDQLARPRPDPGGGAAAAYSAQVGLALLIKVSHLEQSRPRGDKVRKAFWAEHLEATWRQKDRLAHLRQADVEAYLAMAKALSHPREEPPTVEWRLVEEATRCPWQIMEDIVVALELVGKAGEFCRPHLLADLLVATEILSGALQGAHHIACANLPYLPIGRRQRWATRLSETSHLGLEASLKVRSRLLARAHEALNSP
ncbi:MAG: cyclodeaminase/cyclohydrolase family protein [Desulfobaccales bacterium]